MIKFYGATWCGDCIRARKFLDDNKIKYEYINIQENPEAIPIIEKINNGLHSIPVLIFDNGQILVEPTNEQIKSILTKS